MALDGDDKFTSGYKKGLRDAAKVVRGSKSANMVAVEGAVIADALVEQIEQLEP